MGFQEYGESRSISDRVRFFCMAENIVLKQKDVERKNQFFDWWKRSQRIKTIEFSSIIGSQHFPFLSNYNPWVFYQLQHCALMSDKVLKVRGRGSFDYCIDLNSSLDVAIIIIIHLFQFDLTNGT